MALTAGGDFVQIFITDCNRERLISVLKNNGLPFRLWDVAEGEIVQTELPE